MFRLEGKKILSTLGVHDESKSTKFLLRGTDGGEVTERWASDARFQAIEEHAEIFSAYRMKLAAQGERKCVYVLKHSDGMQANFLKASCHRPIRD